jgi:hypothetical protein
MRNMIAVAFAMVGYIGSLQGQTEYKRNFLSAFDTQPEIKTCEAAYRFMLCKDNVCAGFNAAREVLAKASEELALMQSSVGQAAVSPATPAMTPEEARKLSDRLKSMSQAERQQWAVENANKYSPQASAHVNKDMNNRPVNEAVKCVTDQQESDLQEKNFFIDFTTRFRAIEEKYKSQKDDALKKFQTATGTTTDPSSSFEYVFGEASDEEAAKFNSALELYRSTILPIENNEMREKLDTLLQAEHHLVRTYGPVEDKIALTHYTDDALEPANKLQLIGGHSNVLRKVQSVLEEYHRVVSEYSDRYAAVMRLKPANEAGNK